MSEENEKIINTYDVDELKSKKMSKGKKSLIIFALIIIFVVILGVSCNKAIGNLGASFMNEDDSVIDASGDYIGILNIDGTISKAANGNYDHQWILDKMDEMMEDKLNKGMVLFINTPGGGVYESDELYLKILDYKKAGKPVYSAMGSQATSGGYYISAPCDKIYANRNCWTGSIGVTIGTIYDASELLDKIGIKTVTITSGENKAMGNMVEPMTKEQKDIFQSLVDEAYEQFVGIVADGRNMKISKVKKIADGRIYTAKQAKANNLVDEIGTLEDAINDMKEEYKLNDVETIDLVKEPSFSIFQSLIEGKTKNKNSLTEYGELEKLMNEKDSFSVTYMSGVKR